MLQNRERNKNAEHKTTTNAHIKSDTQRALRRYTRFSRCILRADRPIFYNFSVARIFSFGLQRLPALGSGNRRDRKACQSVLSLRGTFALRRTALARSAYKNVRSQYENAHNRYVHFCRAFRRVGIFLHAKPRMVDQKIIGRYFYHAFGRVIKRKAARDFSYARPLLQSGAAYNVSYPRYLHKTYEIIFRAKPEVVDRCAVYRCTCDRLGIRRTSDNSARRSSCRRCYHSRYIFR